MPRARHFSGRAQLSLSGGGREAPLHPTGHAPVVEQNRLRSFMIVTAGERLTARAILAEGGEAGKVFDAFELVSEAAGQRSRQVYAR